MLWLNIASIVAAIVLLFAGSVDIYFTTDIYAIIPSEWIPERKILLFIYQKLFYYFGMDPVPYHIFTLFLHTCNSIFVYYIVRSLTRDNIKAWIGGLLFATFYAASEPVLCITYMYEIFWVFFSFSAIAAFLCYRQTGRKIFLVASLVAIYLALRSKENTLILPLLIALVDYFYLNGRFQIEDVKKYIRTNTIELSLLLILFGLQCFLLKSTGAINSEELGSFSHKLNKAVNLTFVNFAPFPGETRIYTRIYGAFILTLCVLYAYLSKERRPLLFLLLTCEFIALLPYFYNATKAMRYIYFPSLFTMPIFALIICSCGEVLEGLILHSRFSKTSNYGKQLVICSLTGIILLKSFQFTHQDEPIYRVAGGLCKTNLEDFRKLFPNGKSETVINLINLPGCLNGVSNHTIEVWGGSGPRNFPSAVKLTYKTLGIEADFKIDRFSLLELPCYHGPFERYIPTIRPKEFDSLGGRVIVFNPIDSRLIDVSGWGFERLDNFFKNQLEKRLAPAGGQ